MYKYTSELRADELGTNLSGRLQKAFRQSHCFTYIVICPGMVHISPHLGKCLFEK
jgi:hypothetical protein